MPRDYMVDGHLYYDETHTQPIPTPIGGFASVLEANAFMEAISPVWGTWSITKMTDAQEILRSVKVRKNNAAHL